MEGLRVQRELDIAASLDFQRTDHLQGTVAEHVVLLISQCLGRTDDNGVAGMDSNGVDIFHVADRDSCVITVAHDLVLNLLKSLYTFFNENLMYR